MDISPIHSLPFKSLLHSGVDPLPTLPPDKSVTPNDSEEKTGAPKSADETNSSGGKSASTPLEKYMAGIMAELFAGVDPQANIFEKIRQMQEDVAKHAREKAGKLDSNSDQTPAPAAADSPAPAVTPSAAAGTGLPSLTAPEKQSFSLDISIRGVFERVEKLVQHARKEDGGKIMETTASVLEKQSASLNLDFSFTTQFLDQGIDLAKIDQNLLSPFMDAVNGLADFTDDSLQKFMDATANLFNGLEKNFNLQDGALQGQEDLFKKQATRFFDSVKEIVNSPFLLDGESRQKALDIPPDDELFRKKFADIFAAAGGMDAARRVVGGQPSDMEILLDGLKNVNEKTSETEKSKKKRPLAATGAADETADGQDNTESQFANENLKALASGLASTSLTRAAQFFQTISDIGPSKDLGKIRDVAV